jgi:hypothetical protein
MTSVAPTCKMWVFHSREGVGGNGFGGCMGKGERGNWGMGTVGIGERGKGGNNGGKVQPRLIQD